MPTTNPRSRVGAAFTSECIGLQRDKLRSGLPIACFPCRPHESGAVVHSSAPGSDLARFESSVHSMLDQFGLPSERLFVPVGERVAMVSNMGNVLEELAPGVRAESHYVSKMVAAAAFLGSP